MVTFKYEVKVGDCALGICKEAFLSVNGLQNNQGCVKNLERCMQEGHCVSPRERIGGLQGNIMKEYIKLSVAPCSIFYFNVRHEAKNPTP
jgi:hypothetical protein